MAATGLTSCFTGVEGTNKINLSRQDKKNLAPSPEDTFLADVKGLPLARWEPGKEFIAAAGRTAFAAMCSVALREFLISLPLLAVVYPMFRWVHRKTTFEY